MASSLPNKLQTYDTQVRPRLVAVAGFTGFGDLFCAGWRYVLSEFVLIVRRLYLASSYY